MNPVVIGRGRSFKGLAQYLLHDQKATTTERVGWVETVNLNYADPDRGWRLMAGTAKNANAIKQAAGLRISGGQSTKPVYHYTLTWHEDDKQKLTPELQRKAVKESLAALGLSDLQSMAVQHLDGKPHVHVIVNMISPEDGTTVDKGIKYDYKKLSVWAKKFELAHGLKVTEGRAKNEAKRKNGEQVDARRKSRNKYEQEKREGTDRRTAWLRRQESQIAETLSREGKQMRDRHDAAWAATIETFKARKSAIYDSRNSEIETTKANIKARYKSQWRDEFAAGRKRLRDFDKSEKSGLSRMVNRVSTYWKARNDGADVMSSVFTAATHAQRREFLEAENKKKTDALAALQRRETSASITEIMRRYGVELDAARTDYLAQCSQLKSDQARDRADHRQQWRDYNARRQENHARMTGEFQAQAQGRGYGLSQSFTPGDD